MDRASDYGSEGWGFESLRARHDIGPRSRNFPARGLFAAPEVCCHGGMSEPNDPNPTPEKLLAGVIAEHFIDAQVAEDDGVQSTKIGRASCRERV